MAERDARRVVVALWAAALASTVSACGGDDEQATTTAGGAAAGGQNAATAPKPRGQATAATGTGKRRPFKGEQGDEEPIRQPASFTIRRAGRTIEPRIVEVTAFLPVQISISSPAVATTVTLRLPRGARTLTLGRGDARRLAPRPLPPGRYAVTTDRGGRATLAVERAVAGP